MKKLILLSGLVAASVGLPSSTAVSRRLLRPLSVLAAIQDPAHDSQSVRSSPDQEVRVPLTDRTPWLVHVILISPAIALAVILFSLARMAMRNTPSERASGEL